MPGGSWRIPKTARRSVDIANFEHGLAGRNVARIWRAGINAEDDRHALRRSGRFASDHEVEMGVALHIEAKEHAFGGFDFQNNRRARLQPTQRPDGRFDDLDPWHAVGRRAVRRGFVKERVVDDRQRGRIVKADAAHCGRNREGHGDVVVEHGLVIALAQVAMVVAVERPQAAKTLNHVRTHRTEQQPVHFEQADQRAVQEKINRLGFGNRLVGGEADRIDAEEVEVVGGTQQRLKARHDARDSRVSLPQERSTALRAFCRRSSPRRRVATARNAS